MKSIPIKSKLYSILQNKIELRIQNAQNAMQSAATAKASQTKSSAGDKFETGRAMMQAEEDRIGMQLMQAINLKNDLAQVNIHKKSKAAESGSLVLTSQGNYFISVGLGKVVIDQVIYYAISPASPIGQLVLGKKAEDKVVFRDKKISIQKVE